MTKKKTKRLNKHREFDAVLSFAGEDREHAEAIARALQANGLSVFYDRDFTSHLWGKRHDEYERIYGPAAHFFVPLVSDHYKVKDWPQFEFGIAKREESERSGEFILPVRIQAGVTLLGIPPDVNWLSVEEHTPEQIASALADKIASGKSEDVSVDLTLLDDSAREATLILGAAAFPPTTELLDKLFPHIDWNRELTALRAANLLRDNGVTVSAIREVVNWLRTDTEKWESLTDQWVAVLKPYESHLDARAAIFLLCLRRGQTDEAISMLADPIESGQCREWTEPFLDFLMILGEPKHTRKLTTESRLQLQNTIGLALIHLGRFESALERFKKLRRQSSRIKDHHWLAQSYLNAGNCYLGMSQNQQALGQYRRAEAIGRETGDALLVGRALGNTAIALEKADTNAAYETLKESLKFKRKARDFAGQGRGYAQLGNMLVTQGKHEKAIREYGRALSWLKKGHDTYNVAAVTLCIGDCFLTLGKNAKARDHYMRAAKQAQRHEYSQLAVSALALWAQVLHQLGNHESARARLTELLELASQSEDEENQLCAMHGLAVISIETGNRRAGRSQLDVASSQAVEQGDRHWAVRCIADRCRHIDGDKLGKINAKALQGRIERLKSEANYLIAGDLLIRLARQSRHLDIEHSIRALTDAYVLYTKGESPDADAAVQTAGFLADCYLRTRNFKPMLGCLSKAERFSKKTGRIDLEIATRDQRALLMQKIGRVDEAVPLHRSNTELARESSDDTQLMISLHNLGEALSKLGRHDDAQSNLKEAEETARRLGDQKSAINSMHSRALALRRENDAEASKLLQRCRTEAKQIEDWSNYVRAWESAFRVQDVMELSWDDPRFIHPKWPGKGRKYPTIVIPPAQKNGKHQEIPMLPGLEQLLANVPEHDRSGWVVNPRSVEFTLKSQRNWFKPSRDDLTGLVPLYSNTAIAAACGVSDNTISKWINQYQVSRSGPPRKYGEQLPDTLIRQIQARAVKRNRHTHTKNKRPTPDRVSRIIADIGQEAGIVVKASRRGSIKYASAHDIRRGCAQRLINQGVSAETLKLVMRHADFATTERFYGAIRSAQKAAEEIHTKVLHDDPEERIVGPLVGPTAGSVELSAEEAMKLKRLLNSL